MISYKGGSEQQNFLRFLNFMLCSKKSVQGICYVHLIRYNLFIFSKVIFSFDIYFSERNGFTVCQNFLLSVIIFSINFGNYCFFFFSEKEFLCLVKANLFSSAGVFKSKMRSFHDRLRQRFSHERFIIPTDVLFFPWSMMIQFLLAYIKK